MQLLRQRMMVAGVAVLFCGGCEHKLGPPVTLSCNAIPPSVFATDQVTVIAAAGSVSTKKNNNVIYDWSGTGVTGNGTTANVATASLDPGSYTVKAVVKEGKKGKEGLKLGQRAECTASFTVKEFEPPTISCSASPTTIKPGDTATVTATATSPQNRPLTYSYFAAAGSLIGNGNSATFSSTGAPTGPVSISCEVADDKNHTTSADASVTIEAPPPPPPHAQALCTLSFENDKSRPAHVDNKGKACLDEVALDLRKALDTKLFIVESSSMTEGPGHSLEPVGLRALTAKNYLVYTSGIDPSRIELAQANLERNAVVPFMVPPGADLAAEMSDIHLMDVTELTEAGEAISQKTKQGSQIAEVAPPLISKECNAFAAFGYPAQIDLGMSQALAQSFRLIAGQFDPVIGITDPSVEAALCQGTGAGPNCIPNEDWEKVSKGCGKRSAQQIRIGSSIYSYIIWTFGSNLPTDLCARAQFPKAWIDNIGSEPETCPESFRGTFSWRWFATIKDPLYKGNLDNNLVIALQNSGGNTSTFSERRNVELKPIPVSPGDRAAKWFADSFTKHLADWIFGSSGLIVALFLYLWRKIRSNSQETAKPAPPTIVFVAPPRQRADLADPYQGSGTRRQRPRHHRTTDEK